MIYGPFFSSRGGVIFPSYRNRDRRGIVLSPNDLVKPHDEETQMKFKALGLVGAAIAMYSIPALAHHSFAMFDAEKKVTLDGTVKEFQWTNPHSWILMTVNGEQWAIEMGAPGGLARQGWIPKTLTPGMKVTAVIHPLKDGTHGGQFMAVTLPDGSVKGNPNGAANANAGAAPAAKAD
jgi:hypothetical protein